MGTSPAGLHPAAAVCLQQWYIYLFSRTQIHFHPKIINEIGFSPILSNMKSNSKLGMIGRGLSCKYRWVILVLLFMTVLIAFIGRLSTSVALDAIGGDLVWSRAQTGFLGGLLMGIFLVSYGFSNVIFSPNIDKYGSKVVLTFSMTGCSFAVFLGAFYGHVYSLFLVSRLLLGLAQGVLFPLATKVIAGWYTADQRGKANSIFMIGAPIGVALAPIIMGPVIHSFNWQLSFYLVAAMGFILVVPIFLFVRDRPFNRDKPVMEKKNIHLKKAFKELLADGDFRLILVGFTTVNTVWWGTSLWVPTYLEQTTGVNISEMAYLAAIPYLGAIFGLLIGTRISEVKGNPNQVIMFSLFMTAVMVGVLTFSPIPGIGMAVLLLTLVFFFGQLSPPLFFTKLQNTIDGDELGSATGLMNGIANTVGVLGPVTVGVVVAISGSYDIGILSISAISLLGLISFKHLLR